MVQGRETNLQYPQTLDTLPIQQNGYIPKAHHDASAPSPEYQLATVPLLSHNSPLGVQLSDPSWPHHLLQTRDILLPSMMYGNTPRYHIRSVSSSGVYHSHPWIQPLYSPNEENSWWEGYLASSWCIPHSWTWHRWEGGGNAAAG